MVFSNIIVKIITVFCIVYMSYDISDNLKKILTNQTYLGKVKFDKQTYAGVHQSLISSTLFNKFSKVL